METIKINGDVLKTVIKCQPGEFLFATYDATKDPEITSDEIQELISYCQDNNCQCVFLPESNEQVAVAIQDYDAETLRRLEKIIHDALQKKSKIILD